MDITPKPAYIEMCAKRPNVFGVFLDVDPSHLSLGLPYALISLRFDLPYALMSLGFDLPLPH